MKPMIRASPKAAAIVVIRVTLCGTRHFAILKL